MSSPIAPDFIWSEPAGPALGTFLLAHGAGSPADSPFMNRIAEALAGQGVAVARFEFAYMAERRRTGRRRPPPEASRLVPEFLAAIGALRQSGRVSGPLLIGGKSMGGRVAVMTAGADAEADPEDLVAGAAGVAVLGYPFHPIGKPDDLRLEPLRRARLPVLLLQGERDEFGGRTLVEGLAPGDIPDGVAIEWIADGSHDFGPRGSSEATLKGNIAHAGARIAALLRELSADPA